MEDHLTLYSWSSVGVVATKKDKGQQDKHERSSHRTRRLEASALRRRLPGIMNKPRGRQQSIDANGIVTAGFSCPGRRERAREMPREAWKLLPREGRTFHHCVPHTHHLNNGKKVHRRKKGAAEGTIPQ
jgi:hypothetical protein